MIRENADDYPVEEAFAEHPPSGTVYRQNGKLVTSLGVFEHWDDDGARQYSRDKNQQNGKGIDLVYAAPRDVGSNIFRVSPERLDL